MPRVLIVDDHPIVRMGVRAMLEQAPGFEVCGEAGSTVEALRLLSAENPDVTLLDLMLGGRGGADFVAQCLRACPRTRILVLSQQLLPSFACRPRPSVRIARTSRPSFALQAPQSLNARLCSMSKDLARA